MDFISVQYVLENGIDPCAGKDSKKDSKIVVSLLFCCVERCIIRTRKANDSWTKERIIKNKKKTRQKGQELSRKHRKGADGYESECR